MLTRILIIMALVALALWFLRKALGHNKADKTSTSEAPEKRSAKTLDLVACSRCGLHIPREEALLRDKQFFCSPDHAQEKKPNRASEKDQGH